MQRIKILFFLKKMLQRLERFEEQHPRANIPHDLFYRFPHIRRVAMGGAIFTTRFFIPISAGVQFTVSIVQ
jgi:hypothetical protein